jgi:hypothetical protein
VHLAKKRCSEMNVGLEHWHGRFMANRLDYRFENYLGYYGDAEHVKQQISHCTCCGAKLLLSHMSDFKNLMIQETARCLDCGEGTQRIIFCIN